MAYRRSRGKAGKIQPAVETLFFTTTPTDNQGTSTDYIDLSQVASIVNRRFYRQGIQWAVSGFKLLGTDSANITISKLPNTWVMSNAWEKGFRTWQRLNKDATDNAQSIKPKFLDFKIFMDADHHVAGGGANLLPADADGNVATKGEWNYSKIVIPKVADDDSGASSRNIIAVGPNYPGAGSNLNDAVSLIEGYAASRGLPDVRDPNMPSDASSVDILEAENWMSATFNEGTEQDHEVIEDLLLDNNTAPYPFENGPNGPDGATFSDTMYPGGANQLSTVQLHDAERITSTTIGGVTRLKGGMFPCGLIKISISGSGTNSFYGLQIDLVPGNHRGYLCAPMTDM